MFEFFEEVRSSFASSFDGLEPSPGIDGTVVSAAKPDPEVFVKGAQALGLPCEKCIVFEDSFSGVEAAHRGGMQAVGVGDPADLPEADTHIAGFAGLTPADLLNRL